MSAEQPPKEARNRPPRGDDAKAKGAKPPGVNKKERPASKGRVHKGRTRA